MATRDASAPSIAETPRPSAPRSLAFERLERVLEAERDQLPLWLPVGLIVGIAAWFWIPDSSGWIAFLAACGSVVTGSYLLAGDSWTGRSLAVFALAACVGCGLVWMTAEMKRAPRLERASMMDFTATVERVQLMAAEETVRLVVLPDEKGLARRLRVNVDLDQAGFAPGDRVKIRGWMMPPPPMAVPGAYDFSRTAWFQGLGGTGRALEVERLSVATEERWQARLSRWRGELAAHIRSRMEHPGSGGIAAALATGDQLGIPEEDAEAMRRSGLAHLLSVSGLHLTAVVGAVMLLTLKLLALSPYLALHCRLMVIAAAAGAAAGLAYTLLTGAEVPTVRACIAALLVLGGMMLGREALTLRLVAVGALVVLLLWPESLVGPSFQLSFAAIVSIVALHETPRVRRWLSRRDESRSARTGRFLLGLLLSGLAVELALAPIALFHFHRAGFYGALANVIAIPLTTFVIMPLEALALLLDLIGAGAPVWWLAGSCLEALLDLAHAVSSTPGAVANMPSLPRGAFALVVGGGLWLCLWRTRWRLLGLAPVLIGASWAFLTSPPDVLVTGDGKHLVLRSGTTLALLRPKAGDYVRDTLAEMSGAEPEFVAIADLPTAACSDDLCAANLETGGRTWRILATRTPQFVAWPDMVRACAAADIVVADRRLPRGCRPRWLKADRALLQETGGLAVYLRDVPRIVTVVDQVGRHPWAQAGRPRAPQ